ncbi:MAG: methylenetetrahydrofolate reductase C-terminal domain-containing protein [Alphaproteobacteria bacterium]|nr:methylenetetrahydrofolate reductase C-terminal domain-containing protein [Alphaproteobacteria bacterium]MDE2011487.1 methylenetetrahydrofolate reductase C-terminal domain-containing protein [Alphaproteobacteria bacterium]MDE2071878.1 methylenetetrahydrofolate reductase C-terminal domain-containing protein [Alphaproteobacteria bacterium]MDE2350402.1 methylenetetrahydrofolate reductase C-terminal domain-containing protein [Alphaproteobacteria bacterium]
MIVAEKKPLEAVARMLENYDRVLAVGCGTCVTVCFSGSGKEVAALAASLRMKRRIEGTPLAVGEGMVQRQCEWEYLDPLADQVKNYDAVLSLGCGVGVQTLAKRFPGTRVLPALNTLFMGLPTEQGVWEERCQGCGNCVLDKTGGICPVSRCAKQLFNGPCGGSQNGVCEVDATVPCAWHMIWERAEALGMTEALMEIEPAKDWSTSRDGGLRRMVREDLRAPREETKEG